MSSIVLKRKGQGLSVNVIILVALGLIILVIAILLVNRSGRNLSENTTTSCISQGGTCRDGYSCPQGEIVVEGVSCAENGQFSTKTCCRYDYGGGQ